MLARKSKESKIFPKIRPRKGYRFTNYWATAIRSTASSCSWYTLKMAVWQWIQRADSTDTVFCRIRLTLFLTASRYFSEISRQLFESFSRRPTGHSDLLNARDRTYSLSLNITQLLTSRHWVYSLHWQWHVVRLLVGTSRRRSPRISGVVYETARIRKAAWYNGVLGLSALSVNSLMIALSLSSPCLVTSHQSPNEWQWHCVVNE